MALEEIIRAALDRGVDRISLIAGSNGYQASRRDPGKLMPEVFFDQDPIVALTTLLRRTVSKPETARPPVVAREGSDLIDEGLFG